MQLRKYKLTTKDCTVMMPSGAVIIGAKPEPDYHMYIWAIVDPKMLEVPRRFTIFYDEVELPLDSKQMVHIESVVMLNPKTMVVTAVHTFERLVL